MDLEGSAVGVPRDDGQVALLLQHLPCFLDKIGNRVFSHSSKNIIIYPSDPTFQYLLPPNTPIDRKNMELPLEHEKCYQDVDNIIDLCYAISLLIIKL